MGNLRASLQAGLLQQPSAQVIDGSLKFNEGPSNNNGTTLIIDSFGQDGNRKVFTFSCWFKLGSFDLRDNPYIFSTEYELDGGTRGFALFWTKSNGKIGAYDYGASPNWTPTYSTRQCRDTGWYHLVLAIDTTASNGNRVKLYINGERDTGMGEMTQDTTLTINQNNFEHYIGSHNYQGNQIRYWDGHLVQTYFIDGQQLDASYFGFTDPLTNTWRPKKYTGTFGTNGFYLPMDNQDDFEIDKSGNGNDWTKSNFSGTSNNPDVVKDSPSGAAFGGPPTSGITTTSSAPSNYATLNPLQINNMNATPGATLSDGNLKLNNAVDTSFGTSLSTLSMTSGKWYFEGTASGTSSWSIGVYKIDPIDTRFYTADESLGYSATGYGYRHNGQKENNLVSSSYGDSYTSGDTIGVALDLDAGTISFYKNGVIQNSGTPAYTGLSGEYAFGVSASETATVWNVNFGQKPFKHQPPAGYLTLCSANLRPSTVIARPDQYVGVVTYTSDSSNPISIRSFNFKPDMIWGKDRDGANNWHQFDSVRGPSRSLDTTGSSGETDWSSYFLSFDDNGFTVSAGNHDLNRDTNKMCVWGWKAGGAPTADNTQTSGAMTANSVSLDGVLQSAYTPSGSPSTYPKRMSIGTKQGFSIVQFVGNATNRTLPHGLGKPAKFMIVKNMDTGSTGWGVYHDAIGTSTNNYIELQTTGVAAQDNTAFQNTAPTSDLFSIGTKAAVNNDTDNTIAWIWADVPGLQKFGRFTGNSSADGVFVELGFKPAILLIKNDNSTGDWIIWDNERNKFNPVNRQLWPYTTSGTYGAYDQVGSDYPLDFLSNGFKIRTTDADMNDSARTYIYAAWAEAPSFNLYGAQSNAR